MKNTQGEIVLKEIYKKGIKTYKELIKEGENWYSNLGANYSLLGQYKKAEKVYKEAIEKGIEEVYTNYAYLLHKQKRYNEAEEMFKKALSSKYRDFLTYYYYGNLLYEMKRYDEAEKMYRISAGLHNDFVDVRLALASLLCDLKRYNEAEKELREVFGSLTPEMLKFLKNIGRHIE